MHCKLHCGPMFWALAGLNHCVFLNNNNKLFGDSCWMHFIHKKNNKDWRSCTGHGLNYSEKKWKKSVAQALGSSTCLGPLEWWNHIWSHRSNRLIIGTDLKYNYYQQIKMHALKSAKWEINSLMCYKLVHIKTCYLHLYLSSIFCFKST